MEKYLKIELEFREKTRAALVRLAVFLAMVGVSVWYVGGHLIDGPPLLGFIMFIVLIMSWCFGILLIFRFFELLRIHRRLRIARESSI